MVKGTLAPPACPPALAVLPVGNYAIPSCFATIQAAANYINTNGTTGTGTVQFDVAAGHIETAPVGGIEIRATALGTVSRPIVFKKIGAGVNPIINAFTPQTSGLTNDGIIKIIGADYITIDGLTLQENASNTTSTLASNNMTEFGVALFYTTSTDGAQNNTIKNCSISLNRTSTNTFGIFSNSNTNATAMNISNQASNLAGSNSNLSITGNNISNVNQGIIVAGSGSASTAHNDGLIIGGTLANANSITNFGTAGSSGFSGVSGTINGILIKNTKNFNVSFNTMKSSTAPNISTVRGVFIDSFNQAPTGTLLHTISNNSISLANGSSGAGIEGISNNSLTGNATTTININNNDFNNFSGNTGSSGVTFIKNYQSGIAIDINDNTFTNLTINNTSFANFFIDMGFTSLTATGVQNVNGNKIIGTFTKNGASGSLGIYNGIGSSVTGAIVNNNNNEFSNITLAGTSFTEGWRNTDGGSISAPSKTVENNKFENWTGGTGNKTVIFINGFGETSSVSNNTVNNINTAISSANNIIAIHISSNGVANSLNIKNNIITNINCGTGSVNGILTNSKSTNVNVESNQIKNFLSAGSILAIISSNASPTLITISGNDIDNLKSSGSGSSELNGIKNIANVLFKIENNSIKNLEITNTGNSSNVRSINIITAFATSIPPIINNNVIDNLVSASTNTSTTMAGIFVADGANHEITNNTVKNLTSNTSNSGTAGSTAVAGIWTSSSGTNQKINNNLVFNINANNSTTANVGVAGILTSASSTAGAQIYQNTVYGLKNLSTGSSPIISGYLNAGGGVWTVANNMISINNGIFTNSMQCYGINDLGFNGARKYFFNSINIGGTSTSSFHTNIAFQFKRTAATGTAEIKNNIFNMTRSTAGSNYAVANTGTFTASATAVYNYNIFNAPDISKIGLIDTTSHTFGSWQTATGGDANSFTQIPIVFTNTSIADLHLNNPNCDSGNTGTPLSITTDFDNQTRSSTNPTIGADETIPSTYNWNGSWTPAGAPNINSAVIFNSSYDMTSLPNVDACSVTINGSTTVVTVSANKYLNIKNDLTINTGATLNVLNNGSLVQVNDSGINTNNGTGIANVTRNTTQYQQFDYTYFSSPVFESTIGSALFTWRQNFSFEYNTSNFLDLYSGLGNQTTGSPDTFDDNSDDWIRVLQTTPMVSGKGYAIMENSAGPFPVAFTPVTFSGKPNNGLITIPLLLSPGIVDPNDDFNLVGNPYASAISANDFINANLPNISGTLYFWTHKDDVLAGSPGPNVYNYTNDDYAYYNLSGGTATLLTTGQGSNSGSSAPIGFIASGQGFMVDAQNTNPLVFNNAMRLKTYDNTNFWRTSNPTEKDRIWLNLTNTDGMFSQQLIGYFDNATLNHDQAYDAKILPGNSTINFYSTSQNDFYKIQAKPTFNNNDEVALGYTCSANGNFTIAIDNKEGVLNETFTNIYLQDNLLNIVHDLKQSAYNFTSNYGTYNNRFVLKYRNASLTNNTFVNDNNNVIIAVKDSKINILSNTENIKSIQVYDILGRNMYDNQTVNSKSFAIQNLAAKNQTLIVKIKLENGEIVTRKIVL